MTPFEEKKRNMISKKIYYPRRIFRHSKNWILTKPHWNQIQRFQIFNHKVMDSKLDYWIVLCQKTKKIFEIVIDRMKKVVLIGLCLAALLSDLDKSSLPTYPSNLESSVPEMPKIVTQVPPTNLSLKQTLASLKKEFPSSVKSVEQLAIPEKRVVARTMSGKTIYEGENPQWDKRREERLQRIKRKKNRKRVGKISDFQPETYHELETDHILEISSNQESSRQSIRIRGN